MSQQRLLEQERAEAAWNDIGKVKKAAQQRQKEYRSIASGSTADIVSNGLSQTLAFWLAKSETDEDKKGYAYHLIYGHLETWLRNKLGFQEKLIDWIVKSAAMQETSRARVEAIAFLIWLKRFAEAELEE